MNNVSEAIKSAFSKYADFSGRSSRSEYWYVFLPMLVLSFVMNILDTALFGGTPVLGLILMLIALVPGVALSVRRMHDVDRSAWWILFGFVPIIGSIALIYWFCQRGTVGSNRYGADPLQNPAGAGSLAQA